MFSANYKESTFNLGVIPKVAPSQTKIEKIKKAYKIIEDCDAQALIDFIHSLRIHNKGMQKEKFCEIIQNQADRLNSFEGYFSL